jgi:predicted nuclease with TOPRIM domain
VKGISDLRSMHKEMSSCIEETDTEKMVMESKYKQTNEKMGLLTERINELEVKLAASEESFAKMKALFRNAKEECLNQKFQIEELRQQIRTMRFDELPSAFPQQDGTLLAQEVSSIIELGIILRER